ncbi:MAG: hypothetical protein RMI56_02475 [Sulfolobales archaeon]|nr:hypothetical protein [Sulfolobales archaeon]MDW8082643.1 hypothetical protein [Sulfolobales archaeon]
MYVLKTLLDILGRDRLYLSIQPEKLEFKTCVVETTLLIPHEDVTRSKVDLVIRDIETSGCVKYPVLIDARSFIVLDGHHRLEALREIGIYFTPAFFVDYARDYVDVYPFRKDIYIDKSSVLRKALEERALFPPKTTKHVLIGASILPSYTKVEELENPVRSRKPTVIPGVYCYS